MSHPQGIPRRQPPQGQSSRGSWTPAGRAAPRGRRSSGRVDMDMRTQPAPALPTPQPQRGPHRVKGRKLEAGYRPLQEELLRGGEGQAQVEGKLGVRARVRQRRVRLGPRARAPGGVGGSPGGLRRRSLSSSAPGPSWLGVQPRLEHMEDTAWSPPATWGPGCHTLPPARALTSHEDAVPDGDGHAPIGLRRDRRDRP